MALDTSAQTAGFKSEEKQTQKVLRVQSASIWKQQMESDRLKQQQEAKHKEGGQQQHTGQGEAGCLGTHLDFTQGLLVSDGHLQRHHRELMEVGSTRSATAYLVGSFGSLLVV